MSTSYSQRLDTATTEVESDAALFHAIVNGGPTDPDVVVGDSPDFYDIPTLAKMAQGAQDALAGWGILAVPNSPGGVPVLDSGGKILTTQLPNLAITDTYVVASQAAMLALTAQRGDVAVRTDTALTYILAAEPATTLGNWVVMQTSGGDLRIASNLSDLANAATARTNLGVAIGTNVQAYDAALTALAGGSDFVQFAGPVTSTKVFTLPDASATLLYSGGALGTPTSGTVTNLTGTASININGTVGSTTAAAGAFTTLAANGAVTLTANTTSSSSTTGTLVVTGGTGVSGALYVGGTISGSSIVLTGTAGAGFVSLLTQSSTPSAPASGFVEFADSTGRRSWRRASDGFVRTWDATLTANRVYTLQDAAGTILMTTNVTTGVTTTGLNSITAAASTDLTLNPGAAGNQVTMTALRLALDSGTNNLFIGTTAGKSTTQYSVAVGPGAGASMTSSGGGVGEGHTLVGYLAGTSITSATQIVAIGYLAGQRITTGQHSNYIGGSAGAFVTTGANNNFMGNVTGAAMVSGSSNTFIGDNIATSHTSGDANTYVGAENGWGNTSGNSNTAVGYRVAQRYTGSGMVGIGTSVLDSNVSGSSLTAVGNIAGYSHTGTQGTFIGASTDATGALNNVSVFGYAATATAANQVSLGNSSVTTLRLAGTSFATFAGGVFSVAESKNSILTSNGPVYTSGSDGTLNTGTTTGSGTVYVLATSPTLITPVLGVASGTSLTLAGALSGVTTIGASGIVTLSSATDSTSISTGALVVSGGAAITKTLFVNGAITNSSATVPMQFTATDGTNGFFQFWGNNTYGETAVYIDASGAGSAPSGAANLFLKRSATNKSAAVQFATVGNVKWRVGLRNLADDNFYIYDNANAVDVFKLTAGSASTAYVSVLPTTVSTSTTTGSLINAGGFGNAGAIYGGSTINATTGFAAGGATATAAFQFIGTGSNAAGTMIKLTNTNAGAYAGFDVFNDLGDEAAFQIGGSTYIPAIQTARDFFIYTNRGITFNTNGFSGSVQARLSSTALALNMTTASSSFTTGALTVAGGLGVAGDTNTNGWMKNGTPTGGTAAKYKLGSLITALTLVALTTQGIEYEAADGTKLYLLTAVRP